jgi:hypothetical protein
MPFGADRLYDMWDPTYEFDSLSVVGEKRYKVRKFYKQVAYDEA